MEAPAIRYATSSDVSIAYHVVGEGPPDIVLLPGFLSHLEISWEFPPQRRFAERLASFSRLVLLDKRGTGMSDRVSERDLPTLEQRVDDIAAVLDAVGLERASILGISDGGTMGAFFAATHPDRTVALILYGSDAYHEAALRGGGSRHDRPHTARVGKRGSPADARDQRPVGRR